MSEFDWIEARSQCSIAVIFEQLKVELKRDVEKMQTLRPMIEGGCHYGFRFAASNGAATVIVQGKKIYDSVQFRLTDTAIEVVDGKETVKFMATPTLNSKGECRLKINGEEYESWYLRKIALEEIFFRDYFTWTSVHVSESKV